MTTKSEITETVDTRTLTNVVTGTDAGKTKAASAPAGNEKKTQAVDKQAKAEPRVSDTLTEIGRKILRSNLQKSIIFMTTDGTAFFTETDAKNHAKTLNDRKVIPVKKNS